MLLRCYCDVIGMLLVCDWVVTLMLLECYLDRIVLLCGVDAMWMKLGFYWDVIGILL